MKKNQTRRIIPFSGRSRVTRNIRKLEMNMVMLPMNMKGLFLPSLLLKRSTIIPTKGSVTPSKMRIIMAKEPARTTPAQTYPVR